MNSNLQKSIEESLERLLRALRNADYFDKLSYEDKVDVLMGLFSYLIKVCK